MAVASARTRAVVHVGRWTHAVVAQVRTRSPYEETIILYENSDSRPICRIIVYELDAWQSLTLARPATPLAACIEQPPCTTTACVQRPTCMTARSVGGDLGPHLMMVFGPSESAMWRNKRERGRESKKAAGGTSRRECMDGVLSGCSGQLQLVHGAGVRRRRRDVFSPAQNWQVQVSPATRCCGCCSRWVSCASWSLLCPRYGSGVLW